MRVQWWVWGAEWAGGKKCSVLLSSSCCCFLDLSPLLLSSPSPESDWLAPGLRTHGGNEKFISSSGGCWWHALLPATVTVHPALPETSPQMQADSPHPGHWIFIFFTTINHQTLCLSSLHSCFIFGSSQVQMWALDTSYPEWSFPWFSSDHPAKCKDKTLT
jgi:hypothetical protein